MNIRTLLIIRFLPIASCLAFQFCPSTLHCMVEENVSAQALHEYADVVKDLYPFENWLDMVWSAGQGKSKLYEHALLHSKGKESAQGSDLPRDVINKLWRKSFSYYKKLPKQRLKLFVRSHV